MRRVEASEDGAKVGPGEWSRGARPRGRESARRGREAHVASYVRRRLSYVLRMASIKLPPPCAAVGARGGSRASRGAAAGRGRRGSGRAGPGGGARLGKAALLNDAAVEAGEVDAGVGGKQA